MQLNIINLDTGKKDKMSGKSFAEVVNEFVGETAVFMGAFVSTDGCYRGIACDKKGKSLARLEIYAA